MTYVQKHWRKNVDYRLFSENEDEYKDTTSRILISRGINEDILEKWIKAENPNEKEIWRKLDSIIDAVVVIQDAIAQKWDMEVVVDCDADGYCSSAIFINYINAVAPEYAADHIKYYLHTGKQHGLADMTDKLTAPIVIVPDAGSNDYEEHEIMSKKGQIIVIFDHHEAPHTSTSANVITVNNQLSNDYSNKSFSGAGIVYRFCQAYDNETGNNFADDFLDLVALGNLSDMMDYRNLETRYIIHKGLQNIHNSFFYYMVEKNSFSIDKKGGVNYNSIAWYVTPFINAIVRSGTQEEKQLIFESMLTTKAFEKIKSEKRGHKGELVPRVEEAVRVAANVKARQTRLSDASMQLLENKIEDEHLLDNSIIICLCEPGEVEKNLAGLAANKIQAKYQRPCLVLTKTKVPDADKYVYMGSARNYSKSQVQDMREICEKTGCVDFATGHAGAFGISIPEEQLDKFIAVTNRIYANVPQEPIYWVDFIWHTNEDFSHYLYDLNKMNDYWGQEIPEAAVVVAHIPLESQEVQLMSPDKKPTIKVILNNGVNLIKFNSSQEEYEKWTKPNQVLTIVGTPNINEWNDFVTPQILIDDYELREEWIF